MMQQQPMPPPQEEDEQPQPPSPPPQQQVQQGDAFWPGGLDGSSSLSAWAGDNEVPLQQQPEWPAAQEWAQQQQQEEEQQPSFLAAATASPPPPLPQVPDPRALPPEQLVPEGLRLLRSGRDATRAAQDQSQQAAALAAAGAPPAAADAASVAAADAAAAADALLSGAAACFYVALEATPSDVRARGNLGNALLAQGELRAVVAAELTSAAMAAVAASGGGGGGGSAAAAAAAAAAARAEAAELLTRAGDAFRAAVEAEGGWSARALVNWGRAMSGRAALALEASSSAAWGSPSSSPSPSDGASPALSPAAVGPAAAARLYASAVDKFEAVLEEEPGLASAKYRCALALLGWARAQRAVAGGAASPSPSSPSPSAAPARPRALLALLEDAEAYLSDLADAPLGAFGPVDEGLRPAAAAALREVRAELAMAKQAAAVAAGGGARAAAAAAAF
jgi:hypothetical protein